MLTQEQQDFIAKHKISLTKPVKLSLDTVASDDFMTWEELKSKMEAWVTKTGVTNPSLAWEVTCDWDGEYEHDTYMNMSFVGEVPKTEAELLVNISEMELFLAKKADRDKKDKARRELQKAKQQLKAEKERQEQETRERAMLRELQRKYGTNQ